MRRGCERGRGRRAAVAGSLAFTCHGLAGLGESRKLL